MPNMNAVDLSWLKWLQDSNNQMFLDIQQYRDFYNGEHDVKLTKTQASFLGLTQESIRALANYCSIPVDVTAERMYITGFGTVIDLLRELADLWWEESGMDLVQNHVHTGALVDGSAYVLVQPEPETGMPRYYYEPAFDGHNGMMVVYGDEARTPEYAFKQWRIEATGQRRLNVYFPDRIEKYIFETSGWQRFQDETDTSWPIPWTLEGQPIGIPVIHFPNNAQGDDYGKSELVPVVPLQRVMTRLIIALMANIDTSAFPIRTLTGDKAPKDMVLSPGALWTANSEKADWGSLPASPMDGLLGTIDKVIMMIAQVTRVPLSYFQVTRQVASAETQQAEDMALISRVEDRAFTFGSSWREVVRMAAKVWNAFGTGDKIPLDEPDELEILWREFVRIDRLDEETKRALIVQMLIQSGVPLAPALAAAGYSNSAIADMTLNAAALGAPVQNTATQDKQESTAPAESGSLDPLPLINTGQSGLKYANLTRSRLKTSISATRRIR